MVRRLFLTHELPNVWEFNMQKILIIGATSAIAEASAKLWAAQQAHLYLLARNTERLAKLADDLKVRGANCVQYHPFDAEDTPQCQTVLQQALQTLGEIDIVLIAHGYLPEQDICNDNMEETFKALQINAFSTIALLVDLANHFAKQQHGTIAVITSIAGDCPRYSNYVYSTSKNMVSTFLTGLRNRLYRDNVHVLTIKPGPVDTPMTAAFKKNGLWAQSDTIAKGIIKAIQGKKEVVYLPKFWRPIMAILRCIPQSYYKKISLQHAKEHSKN